MTIRCNRCKRRMRNPDDWTVLVSRGVITGHLCPNCQTPEENAEAVLNEATLEYGVRVDGRLVGRPKFP